MMGGPLRSLLGGAGGTPRRHCVRAAFFGRQQRWGPPPTEQRTGDRWKETAVPLSEVEETRRSARAQVIRWRGTPGL